MPKKPIVKDENGQYHYVIEIRTRQDSKITEWVALCGETGPWHGTFPTDPTPVMCLGCMAAK